MAILTGQSFVENNHLTGLYDSASYIQRVDRVIEQELPAYLRELSIDSVDDVTTLQEPTFNSFLNSLIWAILRFPAGGPTEELNTERARIYAEARSALGISTTVSVTGAPTSDFAQFASDPFDTTTEQRGISTSARQELESLVAPWALAGNPEPNEGPRGKTGPAGPEGRRGPAGPEGRAGERGPVGPKGSDGAIGLQGPKGSDGPAGQDGKDGAVGPRGPEGRRGPAGTGERGPAGPAGPEGKVGPAGPVGATGQTGARGNEGRRGPAGPEGPVGKTGPAGPVGATGATGVGERGQVGPPGPVGQTGARGPAGRAGRDGQDGARGAVGPAGPIGATGPAGADGQDGSDGQRGPAGPAGPRGNIGPIGRTGPAGNAGPPGEVGPAGPPGEVGPRGQAGQRGRDGRPGQDGATGERGAVGPAGPRGQAGPAGPAGADGADGLTQAAVDARVVAGTKEPARAGSSARFEKSDLPTDVAYNADLLTQANVDARIEAKVEDYAEVGKPTRVDKDRMPTDAVYDGDLEDFAKNSSTERIDDSKLPTPIDNLPNDYGNTGQVLAVNSSEDGLEFVDAASAGEGGEGGLNQAAVDARVIAGTLKEARAGNTDEWGADKLQKSSRTQGGIITAAQWLELENSIDATTLHDQSHLDNSDIDGAVGRDSVLIDDASVTSGTSLKEIYFNELDKRWAAVDRANYLGAWVSGAEYRVGDIVVSGGMFYIASETRSGANTTAPADDDVWLDITASGGGEGGDGQGVNAMNLILTYTALPAGTADSPVNVYVDNDAIYHKRTVTGIDTTAITFVPSVADPFSVASGTFSARTNLPADIRRYVESIVANYENTLSSDRRTYNFRRGNWVAYLSPEFTGGTVTLTVGASTNVTLQRVPTTTRTYDGRTYTRYQSINSPSQANSGVILTSPYQPRIRLPFNITQYVYDKVVFGLSQAEVDARVLVQARTGNTATWPKTKLPTDVVYDADIAGFLTQAQVDARVTAGTQAPARAGNTARWPKNKLPSDTAYGTIPGNTEIDARIATFARQGATIQVPDAQLPAALRNMPALGTAGQVLQVNSGATALEFADAASGGGGGGGPAYEGQLAHGNAVTFTGTTIPEQTQTLFTPTESGTYWILVIMNFGFFPPRTGNLDVICRANAYIRGGSATGTIGATAYVDTLIRGVGNRSSGTRGAPLSATARIRCTANTAVELRYNSNIATAVTGMRFQRQTINYIAWKVS